jgi:hypothetical protein
MRDIRKPTGEVDAALDASPLAFTPGDGDADLALSGDLHAEKLTSGDADLGHNLDSLVG